jgi:hypothetical protein
MNMSLTQFTVWHAMVRRNRPIWRRIVDTVMQGRPRTGADEITAYLARHQYDFAPALRLDLERRHVCV